MGFYRNVKNAVLMNEEVTHFVAGELGYYAILRKGERLDIIKVFHIQPPIENPMDYTAYMFAETASGFYLFSQNILENRAATWEVRMKIQAEEPGLMYAQAMELWRKIRERQRF